MMIRFYVDSAILSPSCSGGTRQKTSSTSRTVSGLDLGRRYYWHVRSRGPDDPSDWSDCRNLTVSDVPVAPLPEADRVELSIYNELGQKVETLVDADQRAGVFQIRWPNQSTLANGIYLYRLQVGRKAMIKKMVMIK
jgi:hypothetical protein